MTDIHQSIVNDALKPLDDLNVPERLKSLVDCHHKNVMNLASSLLLSGKTDGEVRSAIQLICGSFEAELFKTIRSIAENEVENA